MDYKLIAVDLDGTLFNSNSAVSQANIVALQKVADRGVHIAIATGRRLSPTTLGIADSIERPVYLIAENGAVVLDSDLKNQLHMVNMDSEDISWIVGLAASGCRVEFKAEYDEIDLLRRRSDGGPSIPGIPVDAWKPIPTLDQLINHCPSGVLKVRIWASDQEMAHIRSSLNGRKLYVVGYPYPGNGDSYLDFQAPGVSKKVGIEILASKLGLTLDSIIAFGDDANDMEMLAGVGLGIAMGNAIDEVKRVAKMITGTNDENGIAQALGEIFTP